MGSAPATVSSPTSVTAGATHNGSIYKPYIPCPGCAFSFLRAVSPLCTACRALSFMSPAKKPLAPIFRAVSCYNCAKNEDCEIKKAQPQTFTGYRCDKFEISVPMMERTMKSSEALLLDIMKHDEKRMCTDLAPCRPGDGFHTACSYCPDISRGTKDSPCDECYQYNFRPLKRIVRHAGTLPTGRPTPTTEEDET